MQDLINYLFNTDQVVALIIVLAGAWAIQVPLRRLLTLIEARLNRIVWSGKLVAVVRRIALPLTTRLLGQLAVEIFQAVGQDVIFLDLANRLITLWFLYQLLDGLLRVNLSSPQARFWSQKILLPTMLLFILLHLFGLLDQVLTWGFNLGQANLRITIGSFLVGMATAFIFILLSQGTGRFLKQRFLPQTGAAPALAQAISALVSYTIILVGVMVALSAMGVNLTTLAVIAGGLSVGLGFGLQDIINNFISGFILLFERSIGPGDVVRIEGATGVVQRVGIRSVTIRTPDNVELIVPNSHFLTELVTNLTRTENLVRIRVGVGVTYQADPRQVEQALLEAARQHPNVLPEPPPTVQFMDFGDSSLKFDLLVWTDRASRIPSLSSDLRYHIWDALAAHQIEIPFPQQDLHLRSGIPWAELLKKLSTDQHPQDSS